MEFFVCRFVCEVEIIQWKSTKFNRGPIVIAANRKGRCNVRFASVLEKLSIVWPFLLTFVEICSFLFSIAVSLTVLLFPCR